MLPEVLGLSNPFHYQPGDCTVHHGYTAHGSINNTTDRDRWAYLFSYTPADTRYWNSGINSYGLWAVNSFMHCPNLPCVFP